MHAAIADYHSMCFAEHASRSLGAVERLATGSTLGAKM
jgi:hypothetical protein